MIKKIITAIDTTVYYCVDEYKSIFNDVGVLIIFLIAIILYPVLYAYSYSNEVIKEIPIAVVDFDRTALSRQLIRMGDASQELQIDFRLSDMKEAENLFFAGEARGIIVIPLDFEENIKNNRQATIGVYCDAGYFILYKQVLTGALYSSRTLGAQIEVKKLMLQGATFNEALIQREPFKVETFTLFNPSGGYGSFVVPAVIIFILQQTLLIGIGMLGGSKREQNRFHFMVPLAMKKGGTIPIVLGKSFAYFSIYIINALFTMFVVHRWFRFPDKASFFDIAMLTIPFLLSVTFMGMAIGSFFRKREQSMIVLVFMTMPLIFISGLLWPVSMIPRWLYSIAHIFPSTEMLPAYLRLRSMGAEIQYISDSVLNLWIMVFVWFALACFSLKFVLWRISKIENTNKENHKLIS